MNVTALIACCVLGLASALPSRQYDMDPTRYHNGGTRKDSKYDEDDDKQINLPLVWSEYDYYYDYNNYDYLENWYDCKGDICVDGTEHLNVENTMKLENSSLEITENKWLDVNTSSLWTECAPSVPMEGRLAKFKSCYKWAEDNNNIFNEWYINDVCNYRNRGWLAKDGEIDVEEVGNMYSQLEGFKEYLDSCIQWDGEWPDYYDDYYNYYYDYDYRAVDEKKKDSKNTKSKKKISKNKSKKHSGNKNRAKNGKRNKKKAKNGSKSKNNKNKAKKGNKNETMKRNKNRTRKGNKKRTMKREKRRRNNNKKANKNKNNQQINGIGYKREVEKVKKKKNNNKKKKENNNKKKNKKKKRKQMKALNVIDLAALPTEQTVERMRCIDASLYKKLEQCGENVLKNQLP